MRSRSADGQTIVALLPPNSNKDLPNLFATLGANALPISQLPVAEKSAIPSSSASSIAIELAEDEGIALFSATGSCDMGKALAPKVAKRLGRSLLELGGNNATIVCPSADLDLTIKGITFSAAGTAGQRCTTLRRLFVHSDVHEIVLTKLKKSFSELKIGDPTVSYTHLTLPTIVSV